VTALELRYIGKSAASPGPHLWALIHPQKETLFTPKGSCVINLVLCVAVLGGGAWMKWEVLRVIRECLQKGLWGPAL
jgi:hypothetical protein